MILILENNGLLGSDLRQMLNINVEPPSSLRRSVTVTKNNEENQNYLGIHRQSSITSVSPKGGILRK